MWYQINATVEHRLSNENTKGHRQMQSLWNSTPTVLRTEMQQAESILYV